LRGRSPPLLETVNYALPDLIVLLAGVVPMGSSEEVLSPQLQEQISRLQQLQQTLQVVVSQKQQLELEHSEIERALAELDKLTDDAVVYKSVGALLVKSNKQTVLTELKERNDLVNMRVSVLAKQEERAREKLKELQERIQRRLAPSSAPG
jgi:prefoldin beta subunit